MPSEPEEISVNVIPVIETTVEVVTTVEVGADVSPLSTVVEVPAMGAVSVTEMAGPQGAPGIPGPQGPGLPVGAITIWALSSPPTNWLVCNGQAVSRTGYPQLFAILGTTYGVGNGSTTFNLPDLREKVPVGKGSGDFASLGSTLGTTEVELTTGQLPSHAHTINHGHTGSSSSEGAHDHTINHNHSSFTSGSNGSHSHTGTTSADGLHAHKIPHTTRGIYDGTGTSWAAYHPGDDPYSVGDSTDNEPDHTHTITTNTESDHTHSIDVPSFTGTSGSEGDHAHAITINSHSGSSGSIGSNEPVPVVQPSIVVNYIILAGV